jgi:glycosyltransferase involved in cell wall biosynthesis
VEPLRLAVFARGLTERPTGRGFYVRELVEALVAVSPGLRLELFAGAPVTVAGVQARAACGSGRVSDLARMAWGIGREVAELNVDVFWGLSHLLPWQLPRGVRRVVTVNDLVWRDHPETMASSRRWALRLLERELLRADRVVCISAFTRDRLAAHWPELAERARVVLLAGNRRLAGVEREAAARRVAERFGLGGPFILNVDTLEPRKNLGVVLDALEAQPGLTLVHCGAVGWKIEALLRRLRNDARVRLLGYVEETVLADLYATACLAVFPSRYEGFHLPPVDAALCGCPVVLSDIPVHREVLGEEALYFPPDSPVTLAQRLAEALAPGAREGLGGRVQARAQRLSWEASARQLLAAFA